MASRLKSKNKKPFLDYINKSKKKKKRRISLIAKGKDSAGNKVKMVGVKVNF